MQTIWNISNWSEQFEQKKMKKWLMNYKVWKNVKSIACGTPTQRARIGEHTAERGNASTVWKKKTKTHRLFQKILHFQCKIKEFQAWHEIPEDLIINFAQTSLPYDFTGKRTYHIQGTSRKRKKKQITGTFSITISGEFLPMQLIYHRTTDHYLLEGVEITVTYTANRWSDDSKAIQYL